MAEKKKDQLSELHGALSRQAATLQDIYEAFQLRTEELERWVAKHDRELLRLAQEKQTIEASLKRQAELDAAFENGRRSVTVGHALRVLIFGERA